MESASGIDLCIAIVNWNTRELLEQCLASLGEGTAGIRVQIVVVDNGSVDGSVGMVRGRFPHVELIANEVNLGYARGNNQAYAVGKGRHCLLLNPDTIILPGALTTMVSFLEAWPEAAGVTCRLLNRDGSFQRIYTRLPAWRFVLATHTSLRALWPDNRLVRQFYMADEPFDRVVEVEQPSASCLMIRRSLFPGSTLLDERFPILFNDTDLYRFVWDRGLKLYLLPEGEVVHYRSAGGVGQMGDEGIIDYLICLVRYYRKHDGPVASAMLWTLFTLDSLLILAVGLVKFALGVREMRWLQREFARRFRLMRGRELFQYPAGFVPAVPQWSDYR